METITFYSYKGGVGRTLAVANVAYYLALLGQKVVALDFDLEAPGLHYKFPSLAKFDFRQMRGVVDYVCDVRSSRRKPRLSEYLISVPKESNTAGEIILFPAGAAPYPLYWERLSGLDWQEILYSPNSQAALFLELKEQLRSSIKPDFLLVDSRTGITEIGGVATTLFPDILVCLLLNNREHLEGAREVLRALTQSPRPPGASPTKVYPVLSRLPLGDVSAERRIFDDVRAFLNEPAENVAATLSFDEVLPLHSDPSLNERERILVGGNIGAERPPLLQDYLRLFAKISPKVVLDKTQPIIKHALDRLLDAPEEAQQELENLAFSFNVQSAFRELLRIYRLRNLGSKAVLGVAQRLWDFGDEDDLHLIHTSVMEVMNKLQGYEQLEVPLHFIEDVWRRGGRRDISAAIAVAERLNNTRLPTRSLELLQEAWRNSDKRDDDLLAALIRQMRRNGLWSEARGLVDRFKTRIRVNPKLLQAWASLEIASPGNLIADELLEPEVIKSLDDSLAAQILLKAGRREEATSRSLTNLTIALRERDLSAIFFAGRSLVELGELSDLRNLVERALPGTLAARTISAVINDRQYEMPNPWEFYG